MQRGKWAWFANGKQALQIRTLACASARNNWRLTTTCVTIISIIRGQVEAIVLNRGPPFIRVVCIKNIYARAYLDAVK